MKRKTAGLFIVVAVLAAVAWAGWRTGTLPNDETLNAAVLPRPGIFKTGRPQRLDFTETRRWFGKVESRNQVRIVGLASGTIVSVAAGDGMPVTKGAPLFTIGGPLVDSRLQVLHDQSATLRKRVTIAERVVGVKRDAVSRKFARHEELAVAEDALARLKTELESAIQETRRLQDAIHVQAPISGVFTNRKVSVGQEVRQGDNLAKIISVNHLYIAATIFPRKHAELEGKPAVIKLAHGSSIPAAVTRVLPERTAEGAVVVWIEGPGLDQSLRPGEAVTGTVALSVHRKALTIPQIAVVRDEKERAYVFLKDSSGYRKKPVKTGLAAGGIVEITSGLRERDEVVVQGAYELFYRDFNKIYKVAD